MKILEKIKLYYQEMKYEIKKAIFPPKQEYISIKQGMQQLKGKNKNELTNMLIELLAEKNRLLPNMANRQDFKNNSKRTLINVILHTHIQLNGVKKA